MKEVGGGEQLVMEIIVISFSVKLLLLNIFDNDYKKTLFHYT